MFPFPTTAEILNLDTLLHSCRRGDGAQIYHHAEGDLKTMDHQVTQQTPYPARYDPNAALSGNWQKSNGGRVFRPKTTINNLPAYPVQKLHSRNGAFPEKIPGTVIAKHRLGWGKACQERQETLA
jgi:hypothetical protein